MQRVPQPAVDRTKRQAERREPWAALALLVAGAVVLFCGATHVTEVPANGGSNAREIQLVQAFASGGLHYTKPGALPGPSVLNDPTQAAAAFERLQQRDRKQDKLRYRVDLAARTPCPT